MKKNFIGLVVGILIMIFLLYRIGIENIVNLLLKIKLEYFIAALFVYFIVEIIAALILKIVIKGKFISILSSHMCGMILSAPTPGRLGYYYTAYSLSKKTKHSTSENIGYLTIIQGLSFLVKVFLCIIAIIYFSSFILPSLMNYFIIISVFPVLFFIGIILMLYTKLLNNKIIVTQKKIIGIEAIVTELNTVTEAYEAIQIPEVEDLLQNIESLLKEVTEKQSKYNQILSIVEDIQKVKKQISKYGNIPDNMFELIQEAIDKNEKHKIVVEIFDDCEDVEKEIAACCVDIEKELEKEKELLKQLDRCPSCNQELTDTALSYLVGRSNNENTISR